MPENISGVQRKSGQKWVGKSGVCEKNSNNLILSTIKNVGFSSFARATETP